MIAGGRRSIAAQVGVPSGEVLWNIVGWPIAKQFPCARRRSSSLTAARRRLGCCRHDACSARRRADCACRTAQALPFVDGLSAHHEQGPVAPEVTFGVKRISALARVTCGRRAMTVRASVQNLDFHVLSPWRRVPSDLYRCESRRIATGRGKQSSDPSDCVQLIVSSPK